MSKQLTCAEYKQAKRLWARIQDGLPVTPEATEAIIFKPLEKLFNDIHEEPEVKTKLEELRDIQLFIMSGKSLVAWTRERGNNQPLPAWARLPIPPLPVGQNMPPNKCLAPAFAV